MNQKEIAKIQKKLLEKKEDLMSLVNKSHKKGEHPEAEVGDVIDIATNSFEKEILFELNDNERQMLYDIEEAIQKIDAGKFGTCETCTKKISKPRLQAMPFARHCIECQSKLESKK
ncbi:TraR/DksA family transcriptional regulator [bacterium]